MSRRWFVPTAIVAAVLMVAMSVLIGARSITAQDATPDASPSAGVMMAHPGHIHEGTCDTLGAVVFPLSDATAPGMGGSPVADSASPVVDAMASPTAGMGQVVAESTTEDVGASLADIIAGGHAINFHESAENIQNYIACGDITGTGSPAELTIALVELNDSGYVGMATLTDNGDGTTTVVVMLSLVEAGTPVASPTA